MVLTIMSNITTYIPVQVFLWILKIIFHPTSWKRSKTLIARCVNEAVQATHIHADKSINWNYFHEGNLNKYITHIHIWATEIYIDIYLYSFGYIHTHYSRNNFWLIPLLGIYHTNAFTHIKWHFYKIIHCSCVSKAQNWKPSKWRLIKDG